MRSVNKIYKYSQFVGGEENTVPLCPLKYPPALKDKLLVSVVHVLYKVFLISYNL